VTFDDVAISFAPDAVPGYPAMADDVEKVARQGFQLAFVSGVVFSGVRVDGCDGAGFAVEHGEDVRRRDVRVNGAYVD
jgi:hypothetical protein